MISARCNAECLARLGMLKFFPAKESVVAEIGKMLNDLCLDDNEARMLADAVSARLSEWPGPSRIRDIHASEIEPRRPRPAGCVLCRSKGWREMFMVTENGSGAATYIEVGNDERAQEKALKESYAGSETHKFCGFVAMRCQCALGSKYRESKPHDGERPTKDGKRSADPYREYKPPV